MADLDFRPQRRDALVRVVRAALRQTPAGSEVRLRGSLASGTAGPYSDIDLLWVVSDEDFPAALARLGDGLGRAHRVASVRVDPDFALSDRRRLVFVRLEDIPLFWRVDIEVRAASIADVEDYDTDNLAARSEEGWSRPASALNNAIGAVKALSVGDLAGFDGLVERAYERIRLSRQPGVDDQTAVVRLMDACVAQDPALSELADQVRQLLDTLATEVPLAGGYINEVVRIGHTVRRPVGPRTPFVHRLLGHLARVAYPAPRMIGIDRQGREVLGFIEGVTHSGGHSDEAELRAVMRLIRRLHDATEAVSGLSDPGEVVCHNDLSPRNTIYVGHEPVAFIDWDLAASGNRIRDVLFSRSARDATARALALRMGWRGMKTGRKRDASGNGLAGPARADQARAGIVPGRGSDEATLAALDREWSAQDRSPASAVALRRWATWPAWIASVPSSKPAPTQWPPGHLVVPRSAGRRGHAGRSHAA